ncbi:MAG: hypothetical protein JW828_09575 [Sedimentisphaerales bacterium]|nr:hypothetical protein [Sedimentisphaerales bacterium]
MEDRNRTTIRKHKPGSALILVVVLTVLLSLIGVLFVMVSRLGEMGTSTIQDEHDIDAGVQAVVQRIETVLVDDLFGKQRTNALCDDEARYQSSTGWIPLNEPFDKPGESTQEGGDRWLADIEPEMDAGFGTPEDLSDDIFVWRHISDLYYDYSMEVVAPYLSYYSPAGSRGLGSWTLLGLGAILADSTGMPMVQLPRQLPGQTRPETRYYAADADGDGVWDSLWVRVPDLYSSKGRPVWAAVRIVDNGGMLNLNAAYWQIDNTWGRFLELDYVPFLRGRDRDPIDVANNDYSDPDSIRRYHRTDGTFDSNRDRPSVFHRDVLMRYENPGPDWRFFEIDNELEIRNRFLLTSSTIAPFETEPVTYETFDYFRGQFQGGGDPRKNGLRVAGVPFTNDSFGGWKWRVNPANFSDTSGAWEDPSDSTGTRNYNWRYDRRHVCTFYSFDRNIGQYRWAYERDSKGYWTPREYAHYFIPANGSAVSTAGDFVADSKYARQRILQLLYAFRSYFMEEKGLDKPEAAKRSAQIVANMIDFIDAAETGTQGPFAQSTYGAQTNQDGTVDELTYITGAMVKEIIKEVTGQDLGNEPDYAFGLDDEAVVYGFERQPFITALYCTFTAVGVQAFGIELANPYDSELNLNGWRIRLGSTTNQQTYTLTAAATVPAGTPEDPSRLVIRSDEASYPVPVQPGFTNTVEISNFGLNLGRLEDIAEIQRPDPRQANQFITIDQTPEGQLEEIYLDTDGGRHITRRDDNEWKFAVSSEEGYESDQGLRRLGVKNQVDLDIEAWQLPVKDSWDAASDLWKYSTLTDFGRVVWLGSEAGDPNAITTKIGLAAAEGDVRCDIDAAPELLGYISFLNRSEGTLPGRVNVNSATKEVIRAAIPPNPDWVDSANGEDPAAFADLLASEIVEERKSGPYKSLADLLRVERMDPNFAILQDTSGDPDPVMDDDVEERDWILSRMSNIFTTRSDVFTAYIAIRIGAPQIDDKGTATPADDECDNQADRRMIAIFDRSHVSHPSHRPKLVALHPVPEAR